MLKQILNALLALTVVIASIPVHADTIRLPDIGDPASGAISPEQEHQMGAGLLRQLRQEGMVQQDPLLEDYIRALGYKLASNSDAPSHPFTFFIVNSDDINAFAAPGGYIGVNRGLILTTQSESELAAVMSHEIAHITQHHLERTYEAAGRYKWATAIALLAAALLGQQSGQLGEAALITGMAANAQLSINFTRANEEEADALGMRTLERSGFNPFAMANFFERMQKSSRLYGGQLPEFLSTHPVTVARIADARARAAQYPRHKYRDSQAYFLAKARLRVLAASDPEKAEREFQRDLHNGTYQNATAEHYGYALALLENGKYHEARAQLEPLLHADPDRIAYLIASARLAQKSGSPQRAFAIFRRALLNFPNNHSLTFFYAQGLLHAGQADQARRLLADYVRGGTTDAAIYRLYSRAAGNAGHIAEAYQAMAEYYFLNGQTDTAIDQLSRAAKLKGLDFYRASQIQARLRQLKSIARQERN